jgi:exonuclease III
MIMFQHKLKIATLNCRGLRKINYPKKRQLYIRHLRSLGYDVLLLQETHAINQQIIQDFNFLFQTTSSHWTTHCGIVSLNNRYSIDVLQDGIDGGRFILANIRLTATSEDDLSFGPTILTVLNIYGRAGSLPQRSAFFTELLNIPFVYTTLNNTYRSPTLVMGDFNYSYDSRRLADGSLASAPDAWTSLLNEHFVDCFKDQKQPTWSVNSSSSIIDYIFCGTSSHHKVDDVEQIFINNTWTDHDLLGISFLYDNPTSRGPGVWKANPLLAKSKKFRADLAQHLQSRQVDLASIQSSSTPQQAWDWVKGDVKHFIKTYQLADNNWRAKELKRLQRKRNMMLRQSKNRGLYFQVLETINVQIGALQESAAELQALKAGKNWREKGEKFAGYLKHTATTREAQRSIHALLDPATNTAFTDQPNKLRIAKHFYSSLFTPDLVEPAVTEELLSSIPVDLRLDTADRSLLTSAIDFDDILEILKASPRKSSPGSDGLPFEILNLVVRFPPLKEILIKVFNDALDQALFPDSWNDSIMTLLKKKGDSKNMGNYRPLSLANCDYKCLTKILNQRMMIVSPKLINAHQIGFIPGKYIAENGLRCQLLMEDAELRWTLARQQGTTSTLDRDIGLLLDQEKAYDRVNLSYFRAVLNRYGFPVSIVNCIHNLMANNQIKININGYLTDPVAKLRGFKQGDPISCICYDLAFEPFLQSILQDQDFRGYELQNQVDATAPVIPTKILCYADDALVFVHDKQDLRLLKYYMDLFCRASNARFNYSKVDAFSLSGRDTSGYWSRSLADMNIHHLHTASDPNPLIYLGFPLIQSTLQRSNFTAALIQKLKKTLQPHSCRSVSVLGKATIVNTLLLSKCWYILRVIPFTQKDIQQITSVAIQFLKKGIFPVIPWKTWTLPRSQGGLGILDVNLQYAALYFRWIFPLLHLDSPSSTTNPLLAILIYHINNQNRSSCHQLPLLFPVARKQLTTKRRANTIDMMYQSIDMLPRDFDEVAINLPTALTLPLSTVIYSDPQSTVKLPRKVHSMTVADVFVVHPTEQYLHWKRSFDPSLAVWQRTPRQLIQGISKGTFKIQPFFLPLCVPSVPSSPSPSSPSLRPFVTHLTTTNNLAITSSTGYKSKSFRQACSSASVVPQHLAAIASAQWSFFWSLSLTMIQRNVVYRLINKCIPHQSLLHLRFPTVHLSPLCVVCSLVDDSIDHFLFECPLKATVWQGIISEFLWPTVTIADIRLSLLSLDFYNIRYSQRPRVSSHHIVIIAMSNIWKAHYRLIFDQTPFAPAAVLNSIRLDIQKMIDEDLIHASL